MMEHATKDSSNRTCIALTIGGVSHNLAFYTVLLGGKGEGAVRRSVELGKAAGQDISEMEGTNFNLNILEAKGMFYVPCGISIFARAK